MDVPPQQERWKVQLTFAAIFLAIGVTAYDFIAPSSLPPD